MNGHSSTQPQFDFRTGRPTAITGPIVTAQQRADCSTVNRERARGITEADRSLASCESVSPDVWASLFAQRCSEWDVPLIPLERLGIGHNPEKLLTSSFLQPLKPGAEACPFEDKDWGVVYKLFPLNSAGGLGKTLLCTWDDVDSGRIEVTNRDADLRETVEKLSMLHLAGALPTEIVGLAQTGDYLIAKQPLAYNSESYEEDKAQAIERIKGVTPRAPIRRSLSVVWLNDEAWFVADLHPGNIMRDARQIPTIIDALCGPISPLITQRVGWLSDAVNDAKLWRITGSKPQRKVFGDDSNDDDL